jgi:hypothetical protein
VKPKKAKVTTPAETTTATTARVLFVDVVCSGVNPTPLEPYVNGLVQKICAEADVADLRFAPGDNPLGFGRWKGALAAAVRQSPPEPGEYLLLDVRESEIRQVVVEALQPLCTRVVRGR